MKRILISTTYKKYRILPLLPISYDAEIARQVGASREWVRRVRNEAGIPSPLKWAKCSRLINEEQWGHILRLAEQGIPIAHISKSLNIPVESIRHQFRKLGYVFKRGGPIKIKDEDLLTDLHTGLTRKQMANKWKVDYCTIVRRLIKLKNALGGKYERIM